MRQAGGGRTTLIDILDRVLDKGIVIDATVRVSFVGIDLLGVDAKITVASFQTYLQLAEDPRAYEAGLLPGEPPPLSQPGGTRLGGRLGMELTEPAPSAGGGGGTVSEPEELGRAAFHEEPTEPEDG